MALTKKQERALMDLVPGAIDTADALEILTLKAKRPIVGIGVKDYSCGTPVVSVLIPSNKEAIVDFKELKRALQPDGDEVLVRFYHEKDRRKYIEAHIQCEDVCGGLDPETKARNPLFWAKVKS